MALTFPFALTSFANLLPKTSVRFDLKYQQEMSGLAVGQVIVADLGPAFWEAEITMINLQNDDWRALQALVLALDGGLNDFYLYDPRCAYPQYDPDGSKLGSSTITNTNVASNGKVMDFTGFPNNYKINPGDMFSFDYGSGNAYRALHMVVNGGTANSSHDLNNVEFRPHLDDPSLATGKTMDFIKPAGRFKMIPGTYDTGAARQMMTTGMTLKARQIP